MAAPSATHAGYTPVEAPAVSVAADGRLAAVHEATRVTMLELPSAAPFAEVSVDPDAVGSEVGWIGTPGRLLVLSRYEAHSTVHLLDPRGPRSIAEIRLEASMRLVASVGNCALVVGALGAAVVAATETHLTLYPFPTRTVPATAGAAGTQFVVALPGSVEEWDPRTRMPTRRLRLPRAAAITAVGGSERLIWMTTQQEPARIDVIPLMNRGQPRAHDLPEPIGRIASNPRSEMLAVIGADSGRLYAIDLDGRIPTRILGLDGPDGIDRVEAAAVLGGRAGLAVIAQTGRPVALVALDRRDAEPAVAAAPGIPTISVAMAREPAGEGDPDRGARDPDRGPRDPDRGPRASDRGEREPERRTVEPARNARPSLDLRAASDARTAGSVDVDGGALLDAGGDPDAGDAPEAYGSYGAREASSLYDASGDNDSLIDDGSALPSDQQAPRGDSSSDRSALDWSSSEQSSSDRSSLDRSSSSSLDWSSSERSSSEQSSSDQSSSDGALLADSGQSLEPLSQSAEGRDEFADGAEPLESSEPLRSSGEALSSSGDTWGSSGDAPGSSGDVANEAADASGEALGLSSEPLGSSDQAQAFADAPVERPGPTAGLRALRERAAPVAPSTGAAPAAGDASGARPPSIALGRGSAATGPRAALPAMRSSAPRPIPAAPTTRPAPFVPRPPPRAAGERTGDARAEDPRAARPAMSASERFSSWRDQVRQSPPRAATEPPARPAAAPRTLTLGSPPRAAGGVTFSLDAGPADPAGLADAVAPAGSDPGASSRSDWPSRSERGLPSRGDPGASSRRDPGSAAGRDPAAAAERDPGARSWRDEVVAWSRAVLAGHAPGPVAAPPIDALVARLDLAPSLQPVLALLYGAHLCGERGVAPVEVSRLLARSWDEALGRGELAQHALASFAGSRVALAPVVQRMLDELPPLSGALLGEPGNVALLGPCIAVAGDEPLGAVAARCVAAVGSAILVAHDASDRTALAFEARIYGAVAMRRIADAEAATNELTIFVVPDEALAEQLGLPRLA